MRIVTHTLESLVAEVTGWHLSHFGREPLNEPLADKLVEEASEFRTAVIEETRDMEQGVHSHLHYSEEEAADVLIVLAAWAGRNQVDLIAAARAKLAKVKGRNQIARDKERGILPAGWEPAPAEGGAPLREQCMCAAGCCFGVAGCVLVPAPAEGGAR